MTFKRLYLTLTATLLAWLSFAAPYCDIRKFSILDGLAANNISDLKQGHDNIMWFGTWNGLSYYDGYTFHTFRDEPDNTHFLTTNRILSIYPSYNNNVWFITYDFRPYIFDTHECTFIDAGKQINEQFGVSFKAKDIYPLRGYETWLTTQHQNFIVRSVCDTKIGTREYELIKVGEKGLRSGNVWFIKKDKKNRVWILTDKGTTIYGTQFSTPIPFKWFREVGNTIFLATEDGRVAVYDEHNHLSMIPMPASVTRINELKNTGYQLIIATNIGLVIYNPRTFNTDIINVQNPNQPVAEVKKAYVDSHNQVWAFTEGQGVTLIDTNTGATKWLYADAPTPTDRTISDSPFIMEDEHGTLWLIPKYGTFCYYDRKSKELVPYVLRSNSSGNYRVPRISLYTISDQGILWLTGIHDLTQINFKFHPYTLNKLDEGEAEARAMETSTNGTHWTGFYNGCLKVCDSYNNKIGYVAPNGKIVPNQVALSKYGIYALYEDNKGRMWIGTKGDGIYMLSNGILKHFVKNPQMPNSLPCNNVYDIATDRRGRIWIATFGCGLALAQEDDKGNFTFFSSRYGLKWPKNKFKRARRITCMASGEILVGTTEGLVTFMDESPKASNIHFYTTPYREDDTTSLSSPDVNYILVKNNGDTFISCLGGTLDRIISDNVLQDNLKATYNTTLNTDEGAVQSMIEDNSGNIWIVRESSIDKYDPKNQKITVFGSNDFDLNITFTEARPIHDPYTDDITVGTPVGSLTFNPKTLKQTNYQPRIIFTNLHYNGTNENIPILHREELVIPSDKRNLTISFAALDYTRKYQQQYKYRLDGYTPEGKWIDIKGRNTLGFNKMPNGKFTLKVMATNTHGKWSKYVAEIKLDVRPTFWESIWGRTIILCLLMSIIGGIFYIYTLRQRQRISHDMSMMKNEFFSNASHKLRTPLSLIGGPVTEILNKEPNLSEESKSLLGIVQKNAREMLDMLNKMLKYDNNSNLYLDDGAQKAFTPSEGEGYIDDQTAKARTQDLAKDTATEFEKGNKDITILVVEDNADLRQFLYSILHHDYNIIMAENGKEGLQKARTEIPDFILTDVTMPVMDGITMVHYIKQDTNIAHIPIIILSAKASVEDHLKGYEEGIDGYLTKPFSATYLKGRIEAVINQRHALQQDMLKQIQRSENLSISVSHQYPQTKGYEEAKQNGTAQNMYISDEATERIVNFINENIANPDMKIDDIAQAMGMSRSVLYGKIKNAVGMTPVDFVKHIRIMRAAELLTKSNDTLSNIAYSVGFSDPKYFSKVFKKEMGIIPSEYRERSK